MPAAIAGLLVCLWLGEALARLLPGIVNAPVAGLVLLYLYCAGKGMVEEPLHRLAATAHRHFAVLFVPAGVGIVEHLDLLATDLPAIAGAIVVGTLVTIAATAATVQFLPAPARRARPASAPLEAMHAD